MSLARLSVAVLLLGLGVEGVALTRSAPLASDLHTIVIENMQFSPAELIVRAGQRVVWINKDLVPHTATSETKAFDSHSIESQASWSYIPRHAGEYRFVCTFHPTMKGILRVVP